jgi:peptidyl-prolyl cis-trans isomerase SurA
MMTRRVLSLLACSLLCGTAVFVHAQGMRLPGPAAAPAEPATSSQRAADYIVAVVNSDPITNHQVRQEAQRMARQLAQSQQPMPDAREISAIALERLINERAQLQLARDTGIRIDDAAVDEAERNIARQNQLDLAEMHKRLAADGIDRRQFRGQLRDQLTLVRLRERDINQRVRVTELEIDQYLREQQRNQGLVAPELHIAHVLLGLPDNPSSAQVAAAEARARQVMDRARAGEDFSALARELSNAPDAANGGQLGLRPADRYPTLFVEATRDLAIGAVGMVRSGAGVHVLKLLEKRAAGMPTSTVDQTLVSHILLRLSAQLSEAGARQKLTALRARILAGQSDFATLARENSQDGSAAQGGELGWASPGQFVPEFEDAMNTLAPGQISEPVVSRFGVHLITVKQRRNVPLSQREQREAIRGILRDKKMDEAFANWAQDLRAKAYVEMRESPG